MLKARTARSRAHETIEVALSREAAGVFRMLAEREKQSLDVYLAAHLEAEGAKQADMQADISTWRRCGRCGTFAVGRKAGKSYVAPERCARCDKALTADGDPCGKPDLFEVTLATSRRNPELDFLRTPPASASAGRGAAC